ncbi:MAG: DNA repair protein RecN [Bacteroidota bacterium]|nr:DNA repair protein RecN [Bacteroidota bacterium]
MITSLKILNYALIDNLDISFTDGLSCITGETGAGKSILMGGLSLVLGKRADLNVLKDPNKKCVIEATFYIDNYSLRDFFDEAQIDYQKETLLRREIIPSGKSRAFINDSPVTLEKINRLSDFLIDVHSQNENQTLFKDEYQFLVLDALAKNDILLNEYNKNLIEFNVTKKIYDELLLKSHSLKQESDYNKFLYDELVNEDLNLDSQISLMEEIEKLSNVEDLQLNLSQSIQIIEGDQIGLLTQISNLKAFLKNAVDKSNSFSTLHDRVTVLDIELKDILDQLIDKLYELESNPSLLENLNHKLDKIHSLFHKHNVDNISDLLNIKDQLETKLNENINLDSKIEDLKIKLKDFKETLNRKAFQIHEKRKNTIPVLCNEIEEIIAKMGMQRAKFKVELNFSENFLYNGKDQINFLFSANLGASFRPIKKVASGGEMSRIMLAIKAILSRFKHLPTIVFDEIDTGVSGTISNEIGNVMAQMGQYMQVFTITHLPQVAAKGKQHYKVYKEVQGSSTVTNIKKLDEEDRVVELAQMLSGEDLTETAFDHARQLLN